MTELGFLFFKNLRNAKKLKIKVSHEDYRKIWDTQETFFGVLGVDT